MADALPTPTPSPPPPASRPSLSAEINAATRKQHTELNRLIIDRLPLALPPHASDPALLGVGLAAFAQIFFAFEAAWEPIAMAARKPDPRTSNTHKLQCMRSLGFLRPAGLERSERLRRDLEHIRSRTGVDTFKRASAIRRSLDVEDVVRQRAVVLLAYAWVMYMAVFSGGRWIRQQLANAGPDFWSATSPQTSVGKADGGHVQAPPGFSFLFFEGEEDGEDIKREFKSRLADIEVLLSEQDRGDVVAEAQRLFEHCITLVHELDGILLRQKVWRIALSALVLTLLLVVMAGLYWIDKYR